MFTQTGTLAYSAPEMYYGGGYSYLILIYIAI